MQRAARGHLAGWVESQILRIVMGRTERVCRRSESSQVGLASTDARWESDLLERSLIHVFEQFVLLLELIL